uniref:Uncharacterized protein n=1 Tax=Arundo donax TaxID=35708 RepID=A0A0A9FM90_ARUDO
MMLLVWHHFSRGTTQILSHLTPMPRVRMKVKVLLSA